MSVFSQFLSVPRWSRLREIVLFAGVGLLNTAVDFTVLNVLIALTGLHDGWWLIVFNCLSFLAAVVNSYIWNGRVTFRHHRSSDQWVFLRFVGVNAVGMAINSTVVWLVTPVVEGKLSAIAAVNLSKALAVLASLCWNYFAIRRWIFVPQTSPVDSSSSADRQRERLSFEQQETLQLTCIPMGEQHAGRDR